MVHLGCMAIEKLTKLQKFDLSLTKLVDHENDVKVR
jgi:hypothetical protein